MIFDDDFLMHYGMPRRSGRYPWGSGDNPCQRNGDFLSRVDDMRAEGFTFTDKDGKTWTGDTAIAKSMDLSTTQFRVQLRQAKDDRRTYMVTTAKNLREKGYTLQEIASQMGFNNDSSVRALLNANAEARMSEARNTANFLKSKVDELGMVDVGIGVERELNISREKFNEALAMLEDDGYLTFGGRVEQVTNRGKWTTMKVLCPPDTPYKINENGKKVSSAIYDLENVHSLKGYASDDDGQSFHKWQYPKSLDGKRVMVRYAEDGGVDKDGVVEIRRNVDDISLGNSTYAQVRVLVNGSHYIKGMAVYGDDKDFPDGVDMIFNTNKTKGTPMLGPKDHTVLKNIKEGDNPFGSLIKDGIVDPDDPSTKAGGQRYYYDKDGKKQLSVINKRAEEGDWNDWSDKLPSQFLSKQSQKLINTQLKIAADDKQAEFDDICKLTNPTVKKVLLESFANDCDSAAVHLQAAALPRQKYQVILPLTSIKDNEVYAPNYNDGETVALVRYPHGGTFEIPIVKVNNKNAEGIRVLGKHPSDAIGINARVAGRLSGADFDGDTVMVIPTNGRTKIVSKPPLKDLEGFDPKMEYPAVDGMRRMNKHTTQLEMGKISNLITDMTLRGAPDDELARAVRHSMVVIDAEKHNLNYKQSESDNGIKELKRRYQGHVDDDGKYREGAGTLISRAKSQTSVNKAKGQPKINQKGKEWYDPAKPEGALIYNRVEETYIDKKGKTHTRTEKSTKMAEATDARTLISEANTPQEQAYATYANKMKALANNARKEQVYTDRIKVSASARKTYAEEVKSLESQLNLALLNAPRERQAQLMANSVVNAIKSSDKDLTKEEIKKISQQELTKARNKVNAKRTPINITDKEWEAIQAGAISENQLYKILNNTNIDHVRELATPRTTSRISAAKEARIDTLSSSGYTTAEIARTLGLSASTVSKYINGKE